MRCNWLSARTQFGNVLEQLRWDEIEIQLRQNMDLSSNNFDERQLSSGWDTIWHFHSTISVRCNWVLTKTQFRFVLEKSRSNAIEFPLRHISELSLNNFEGMKLNFDRDTLPNCLRIISIICNWISTKTQYGSALE